jgi:hypothetical protein
MRVMMRVAWARALLCAYWMAFFCLESRAAKSACHPLDTGLEGVQDEDALERAMSSFNVFLEAPIWDVWAENCSEARYDCEGLTEADSACERLDGFPLSLLGYVGQKCDFITQEVISMVVHSPGNDTWCSNPSGPTAREKVRTFCPWWIFTSPTGWRVGSNGPRREHVR